VGLPISRILNVLNTDGTPLPEADCPIFTPLEDGRARHVTDEVFARSDGSYFPVDYVATPMIERNHLTGLVVSFNDITERLRATPPPSSAGCVISTASAWRRRRWRR